MEAYVAMNRENQRNKPRVAVVVPVYNLENYLEDCLKSLLKQSYSNYVVFAVDDGSIDKSGEILDRYATGESRLKVTHKKNGGVASARNEALIQIEKDGHFDGVCFVDADDKVDEKFIENFVQLSSKYGADYVVTAWDMFDKKGISNVSRTKIPAHADKLMDCNECFQHFLRFGAWQGVKSKTYSLFCLNVYFSSKIIKGLRFNTYLKRTEDQDFRVRALARVKKGVANCNVTYLYRLRSSSLSHHDNSFIDDVIFPISLFRERMNFPISGVFAIEHLLLRGWWRTICLSIDDHTFLEKKNVFDEAYRIIRDEKFLNPLRRKFKFKIFVYSLGEWALRVYSLFRKNKKIHNMDSAFS